jgi:hypothetical protein
LLGASGSGLTRQQEISLGRSLLLEGLETGPSCVGLSGCDFYLSQGKFGFHLLR